MYVVSAVKSKDGGHSVTDSTLNF